MGRETSGSVLVRRKQRTCSEVSRLKWGSNTQDTQPVDYIVEAKLRPPPPRPEWLVRTRLLEQLQRATRRAVALIAAPAGYGKTTVVTQWLASPARPEMVAWISLEAPDNDPVRLWTHIATALDRAGCKIARDVAGFVSAGGPDMLTGVLPRIVDAIAINKEISLSRICRNRRIWS